MRVSAIIVSLLVFGFDALAFNFDNIDPNNPDKGVGAFFCTRDLSVPKSEGNDLANFNAEYIKAHKNLNNNENTLLRHCFIMMAEHSIIDGYYHFNSHQTLGFYQNQNGEYHHALYKNEDLTGKVISCAKIKNINSRKESQNLLLKLYDYFSESVEKGYNLLNHNCCSVAYGAVNVIDGDGSLIDEASFNCGVGISRKGVAYKVVGDSLGILSGSSRSTLGASSSVLRASADGVSYVYDYRGEKREDL